MIRNSLDFRLWMYCVLAVEADKWAYSLKDHVRFDFKHRLNSALHANKSLISYIRENNLIDLLEDQGEWFSRALEMIMMEDDVNKKEQLVIILREYGLGQVDTCSDYLPRDQVIELVKRFTTSPEDVIQRAYDNFKKEPVTL